MGYYATLHTHTYKTSCRCGELCNTTYPHLQDSMNKSPVWGTMQHQCHYIPTPTRLDEQVASVGDYATQMPHLQDSIHKSPVWGTMQHKCHTYKTRYTSRRCGGLCNTTYPHLQDSINKSPVWGTMQHQCHTTRYTSRRCGVLCNTTYPHLQDSVNKSPVWGTMQHQCHYIPTPARQVDGTGDYATQMPHLYKTRYTSHRCGGLCNTTYPHLQDSMNKSPVWGTMQHYIPTPTRLDEQVAGVGDYATPMPHLQDSINKSPVWGTMQHQCHTYKTRYTSRQCGGI